jgi:hypothetical protein
MKWLLLVSLLFLPGAFSTARAGEVLVQLELDTNASELGLTLDLGIDSGSNTQALRGTMTLALDCFSPLSQVSLRNFQFRAVTNYQLTLVDGTFTAGATNLQVTHAAPGPAQPYVPVQPGNSVSFSPVPYRLSGFTGYSASGIICFVLMGQGVPCRNVIRLADQPASEIELFVGNLSLSNAVLRFNGTFVFGPTLIGGGASLSGGAVVSASGTLLPCLNIQNEAAQGSYRVGWSSAFPEFHLYRAESLAAPVDWKRVDDALVSMEGTTNVTQWSIQPEGQAFYRLQKE